MSRTTESRSRFRGVQWSNRRQKWQAQIQGQYLGTFEDETEAAEAVNSYLVANGEEPLNNLDPTEGFDVDTSREDGLRAAEQAGYSRDAVRALDFEGSFLTPGEVAANRAAYDQWNEMGGDLKLPFGPHDTINAVTLDDGKMYPIPATKKTAS